MKDANDVLLPEEIRYTKEHVWVRVEGEALVAGISDYAQDQLGEVAFVDLPAEGRHLEAGEEFGSIESVKSVNALYMPVAGTVVACNGAVDDEPGLVNTDCYGEGWLVRLEPDNAQDLDALLDREGYLACLKAL